MRSKMGSFGSGLMEDSAIDVLRGTGAADFEAFGGLDPLSSGAGSCSSWPRLRLDEDEDVCRRLSAASLKDSIHATRRSATSEAGIVSALKLYYL